MKESLYESLKAYGEGDFYPFHMPGHKRNAQSGPLSEWYKCDITEIDGFDNLHQPEGILLDAQKRAAKLFGSEETYFLVNGSTAGILSAISAVANRGRKLVMARNCHKAVYHAAFLNRLETEYVYPSVIDEYGLADGITTKQIKKCLRELAEKESVAAEQLKNIVAGIVLTSPTYDGILSDVEGIVNLAHEYEIPVIVDQAHGAHFGFHDAFPVSSVAQGADFVIQSVHKTMPAPTQTAILHCNGVLADRGLLKKYLQIYQTSSPSYLLMTGIDTCMEILQQEGKERLQQLITYREQFCKKTEDLRYIKIYPSMLEKKRQADAVWEPGMAEPGRLVISLRKSSLTGRGLYDRLREKYHLQMEMCGADYVVAILSMMDEWEGFERLAKALMEIDAEIYEEELQKQKYKCASEKNLMGTAAEAKRQDFFGEGVASTQLLTLADAFTAEYEEVKLEDAVGRAVSDFVNLYPPGIPILAPGESMNNRIYAVIKGYLEKNYVVQGISNDPASGEAIIKVVRRA